jgi:preprotein translocase subunit YajC
MVIYIQLLFSLLQVSFPQTLKEAFAKGELIHTTDTSIYIAAPNENQWYVFKEQEWKLMPSCTILTRQNHFNLSLKFQHHQNIYFVGGYGYFLSTGSFRVFDTKTQKWKYLTMQDEFRIDRGTPYGLKGDTLYLVSWSILDEPAEQHPVPQDFEVISLNLQTQEILERQILNPSLQFYYGFLNVCFQHKGVYYFFVKGDNKQLYSFNFKQNTFTIYQVPEVYSFDFQQFNSRIKVLENNRIELYGFVNNTGSLISMDLDTLTSIPLESGSLLSQPGYTQKWVYIGIIVFFLLSILLYIIKRIQHARKARVKVFSERLKSTELALLISYLKGEVLSIDQINSILKLDKKQSLDLQKINRSTSHKRITQALNEIVFSNLEEELFEELASPTDRRIKSKRIKPVLLERYAIQIRKYL